MEKDINKMTVTELGNEIYLFSKRLQAEQSRLIQMEKLYAEKYNAENKEVKKEEVKIK